MSVLVTDNFNRTNSDTVGTGWEEEAGDWDISSNGVIQTDATTTPGCLRNTTDMGSSTHWAEARMDVSDGTGQIGVLLRLDTTNFTCLSVEVADGFFKLIRVTAGSPDTDTSVGPAHTHAAGMVYGADVDGSGNVRAYLNGVLQHTWTSQSHAAGNELTGLHLNESSSGAVRWGKFRAGDGAYPGPDHPTWIAIGTRGAGTTTTTPTLASGAAGRLAVAHRAIKPSTATATTESGWTQQINVTGGTGAAGVDAGTTRLSVDTDELAGGEGNPTFDQGSTPNSVTSSICTYSKPSGSTWNIAVTSGDDNTHGTGRSATGAASLSIQPGDIVLAICGSDTDSATAFTSPSITASGITFSTTVARLGPGGSGTGNDVGSHVWEVLAEEGSGTVAPSLSLTGGANNCGPVGFVRLRATISGVSGSGVAAFTFTSTAAGVPETFGTAAGSFTFGSTASGVPDVQGQAVAAVTFTGTGSGTVGSPGVQGSGSGAYTFIGAAAGVPETFGAALGAYTFTSTGAGVDRALGVAAASLGFTGTGSGVDRALGAAATSLGFSGIAAGVPETFGTGSGLFSFTGAASGFAGTPPVTGQATGAYTFTSTAAGVDRALGQAASMFGFTAGAAGVPEVVGAAVLALAFTATAAGSRETFAQALAALVFAATGGGFVGDLPIPAGHPVSVSASPHRVSIAGGHRVTAPSRPTVLEVR